MRTGAGLRGSLAVGLLGTGLMVGCSPPEQPWAATAEQYFSAFHEAQATGVTNAALFYADDVDVDMRSESGWYRGRNARVQAMRDSWMTSADPDSLEVTAEEPIYLSLDGAVDPARLDIPEYPVHFSTAYVYTVSDRGFTSEMFAGSNLVGEYFGLLDPNERGWWDEYLGAWSAGDPSAVQSLYADGAVLRDSIAGLRLEGPAAIGAAAGGPASGGALTGAVRHIIADAGGPAFYGNGYSDRGVELLTVDDGSGCPGEIAVALWFDDEDGLIVREERYHRVDALRRCTDPADLPTGWWDAVTVPDPTAITRTGMLDVRGEQVAIWNGTPELEQLLSWGLERFAHAALPLPIPTSVTFLGPEGDPEARYGFVHGGDAADIAVLVTTDQLCPDGTCQEWPVEAKAATLHQLAHLWLAVNVAPLIGDTFAQERGMAWSDPGLPWAEQASELAAETLTWGLMDQPYLVDARLGAPSCQALAADFQELTGAFSDPLSCAEPEAGQVQGR
jgi:hypothetical protein